MTNLEHDIFELAGEVGELPDAAIAERLRALVAPYLCPECNGSGVIPTPTGVEACTRCHELGYVLP